MILTGDNGLCSLFTILVCCSKKDRHLLSFTIRHLFTFTIKALTYIFVAAGLAHLTHSASIV